LFVIGPPTHEFEHGPEVIYLGAVPDSALREAYELASVLVMPSLHETIGLPMPEAMSAGTPVVAADRPYAHDVCEDAALFFDPQSSSDLIEKLSMVLEDSRLRATLQERGSELVRKRSEDRPYERLMDATLAIAEKGRNRQ
jgi:glycosyltransferase involved in cell wall biosynthesis